MIYKDLPRVGSLMLPELDLRLTPNRSSRHGARPLQVWVHRWGGTVARPFSYPGVVDFLCRPSSAASAHVVYAGELGRSAGQATQLVPWHEKAWTQVAYNAIGVSIESADAIWQGLDPEGFARLARIVAFLCRELDAPGVKWVRDPWTHRRGVVRHADGLAAAGGHTACPTTDLALWRQLMGRAQAELRHGGFRRHWGKA